MFIGTKTTQEKPNTPLEFTAMFWKNKVLLGSTAFPLGQCSTDILNLNTDALQKMNNSRNELVKAAQLLFDSQTKKDLDTITDIQNQLNQVLDLTLALPPFRYLIEESFGYSMLLDIWNTQPLGFQSMMDRTTHNGEVLYHFIVKLTAIIDETIAFHKYFSAMLDLYFEGVNKRNEEHYAVGVYRFFTDTEMLNSIRATLPPFKNFDFSQTKFVGVEYAPLRNPDNEKEYIIAERMVFEDISGFLYADFFKGLMVGHCPRRCHNCGTFFLLLSGHNTCYCGNIAPNQKKIGETKTCREIGAHVKESQKKEKRTPAQQEYDKVYNRLKTRKSRGKITVNEWNEQVSQAIDFLEQNQRGELSDFAYRELMERF